MTPPLFVPALGRSLYPGASVALDFTRNLYRSGTPVVKGSPSLLSGWTFTRTSTGYAETAAGALVAFASGEPRVTDRGLLVEELRTNLLLRSQEFDNASWVKTDTTITADSIAAPDGTTTADLATEGSAGTAQIGQAVTVSSGATVAISFYLKRGNTDWIRVQCVSGGNLFRAWFNLATGAVGTSGVGGTGVLTSASIQASASGFYRVTLVGSIPATTACNVFVNTSLADNISTRVSGGTYYPWGAQLEAGAFATSYIPTTSAQATRQPDVAYITGLSLPAQVTVVARWLKSAPAIGSATYPGVFSLNDGATSSFSLLHRYDGQVRQVAIVGGVTQSETNLGSVTTAVSAKASFARFSDNYRGSLNGAAVVGTAAGMGAASSMSQLAFGRRTSYLGEPICGYIESVVIYPTAFTDAQLTAATS